MEKLELIEIIDKVVNKSDLKASDIPSLDLYMDQIMTLFEEHLQDNKRYAKDKLLTKTMINNYTKAGVIKPVKGKKYTKEQIIGMLLIYNLKNTITIQEIKHILEPIYNNDDSLEDIYKQFIEIKKVQDNELKPLVLKTINNFNLDINNDDQRLIIIMALASLSNQLTNIIQGIIDNYCNTTK
ncbi:MAG: DUF1836 domain-containing protein [Thomasclavelia sp.]|uniref:DUF1836 domain-containing protein n=1 Tax=Thomasclavelia sp. TaxID=3025757 RepID=UPI0039A2F3AC